ncbi:MAG: type II toxin-antitoxin system RelE/ParE family toxin [candidate division Zixibacteria bacterium]|jgi:proteic killer suppression protein|nr:type II toxin-antitoxin system RelE/ParE family toxin [candidate division Zixibacteria bacterium]
MDIEFQDPELDRLAFDETYVGNWSPALVRAYRKRVNQIMQAPNQQVLYAFKGLRLEKLKGKMQGKHSMKINDQFRLIVRFTKKNGNDTLIIIKIEDYH